MIAGGQIGDHHGNLIRQGLDFIAARADQLKYIRVLFMGHNARTCGQFIGEADKAKILVDKQANIHGHFCQ
ncbi:hypothetical protein D3C87_2127810 [compost metagenome]